MKSHRVLILMLGLMLAPQVSAEPLSLAALASTGQSELRDRDYQRARRSFTRGVRLASQAQDEQWQAKFLFFLGNTDLVAAGDDKANAVALARRAITSYRKVLELRPDSGSAMVNLARAQALIGDDAAARDLYKKAIALGDKKQALYRKQYAEFLEQRDPDEATTQLVALVAQQPNSVRAHRKIVQSYKDPKYAQRLPAYLLTRVEKGDVVSALDAALDALSDPDWPGQYKLDLMLVVAASLAGQQMTPRGFARSETAAVLKRVAQADPTLQVCIDELVQTMQPRGHKAQYNWWTADAKRSRLLSQLLRSVARGYAQHGKTKQSEAFYRSAVELNGGEDPAAVRELVEFYSERGDLTSINDMSRRYEYELFRGKGAAYSSGDIDAIYSYHRTLASIYAYQATKNDNWGSSDNTTSAAFQLERAYDTAKRSESITPDVQLVDYLAQSLEARSRKPEADSVRVEAADLLAGRGNPAAAATLLKPVNVQSLSDYNRGRVERLNTLEFTQPNVAAPPRLNIETAPNLEKAAEPASDEIKQRQQAVRPKLSPR